MSLIEVALEDIFHKKIGVGACRTPILGVKNGVFGGLFAAILKLYRGTAAFSRQMVSLQPAVRGVSEGQIFQITR